MFSCKFAAYFRTPFYKNTFGGLLLRIFIQTNEENCLKSPELIVCLLRKVKRASRFVWNHNYICKKNWNSIKYGLSVKDFRNIWFLFRKVRARMVFQFKRNLTREPFAEGLGETYLTLSWRRLLPYRNQSIDLLCKSMDWFLYDKGLPHERVKTLSNIHDITICEKINGI